ncbi:MAG: hypothetical protein A2Y86_02475 [Candidatus Aminicenantes bacterium RBG_13_62_12]|nr:MAG: hypothetical protein A2Y86_02475 [Candidatus Aminicenantes bacterium RBG_13_62_12]
MTARSGTSLAGTAFFSGAAALLFVPLFIGRRLGPLDFWWGFSLSLVLLTGLGFFMDREFRAALKPGPGLKPPAAIGLGILSALGLYAVFLGGGILATALLPAAQSGISSIYGFKAGASTARITALLALVIGPGEELFWRGLLQRRMQRHWGGRGGWLAAAALYAVVHAGSGNTLLILAAGVCGLAWGFLFLRFRSIVLNAVSHALWDVAVFVLWPIA